MRKGIITRLISLWSYYMLIIYVCRIHDQKAYWGSIFYKSFPLLYFIVKINKECMMCLHRVCFVHSYIMCLHHVCFVPSCIIYLHHVCFVFSCIHVSTLCFLIYLCINIYIQYMLVLSYIIRIFTLHADSLISCLCFRTSKFEGGRTVMTPYLYII